MNDKGYEKKALDMLRARMDKGATLSDLEQELGCSHAQAYRVAQRLHSEYGIERVQVQDENDRRRAHLKFIYGENTPAEELRRIVSTAEVPVFRSIYGPGFAGVVYSESWDFDWSAPHAYVPRALSNQILHFICASTWRLVDDLSDEDPMYAAAWIGNHLVAILLQKIKRRSPPLWTELLKQAEEDGYPDYVLLVALSANWLQKELKRIRDKTKIELRGKRLLLPVIFGAYQYLSEEGDYLEELKKDPDAMIGGYSMVERPPSPDYLLAEIDELPEKEGDEKSKEFDEWVDKNECLFDYELVKLAVEFADDFRYDFLFTVGEATDELFGRNVYHEFKDYIRFNILFEGGADEWLAKSQQLYGLRALIYGRNPSSTDLSKGGEKSASDGDWYQKEFARVLEVLVTLIRMAQGEQAAKSEKNRTVFFSENLGRSITVAEMAKLVNLSVYAEDMISLVRMLLVRARRKTKGSRTIVVPKDIPLIAAALQTMGIAPVVYKRYHLPQHPLFKPRTATDH